MDMDTAPTLQSRVGYNRRKTPRSTTNGVQREYRPSTAYEKQILSSKTRLPMLDAHISSLTTTKLIEPYMLATKAASKIEKKAHI